MKHLLKKKSLLSIILILILMFTLCACSGSSPLAKDEDILVGTWEYLSYADYNVYTQRILEFTSDGTLISTSNYCYPTHGPYSDSETFNYTCEDGVLYLEQEGSSISTKEYYRFSEDKKSLYISDPLYSIMETEEKYVKVDSPTDLSSINGNNASDTKTQNDNSDSESYNHYDSEYEDAQSELNLLGTWESEEVLDDGLPAYSLELNTDGTGSFIDPDYVYELQDYYVVDTVLYLVDTDGDILEICFGFDTSYTNLYIEYTNDNGKTASADLFRQ